MSRGPTTRGRGAVLGPLTAVLALALLAVFLVPRGGSTDAAWRASSTAGSARTVTTDTLGLTATAVASPGGTGPRSYISLSGFDLTNQGSTAAHIDLRSLQVGLPMPSDTPNFWFAHHTRVDVHMAPAGQTCAATTTQLWNAKTTSTDTRTFTNPAGPTAGALIQPGQTRRLCVRTDVGRPLTQAEWSNLYAGRAVDLTFQARTASQAPATWSSPSRSVTVRARVAFPAPTRQGGTGGVCTESTGLVTHGVLRWAWPGTATGDTGPTLDSVHSWVIVRQEADGTWRPLAPTDRYTFTSEARANTGLARGVRPEDVNRRNTNGNEIVGPHNFKIRAYPFTSGGSYNPNYYVDSDWTASMWRSTLIDRTPSTSGLYTRCGNTISDPNPARVMP